MEQQNPYTDPTADKSGNTLEILQSLTDDELRQYISHHSWEQSNRTFDDTNVYRSRSYHGYRTAQWIYEARKILDERKANPAAGPQDH